MSNLNFAFAPLEFSLETFPSERKSAVVLFFVVFTAIHVVDTSSSATRNIITVVVVIILILVLMIGICVIVILPIITRITCVAFITGMALQSSIRMGQIARFQVTPRPLHTATANTVVSLESP